VPIIITDDAKIYIISVARTTTSVKESKDAGRHPHHISASYLRAVKRICRGIQTSDHV
jgi:hypothetical protein